VSPVNGFVTNRSGSRPERADRTELMRVINLDDIWVTANLKETGWKGVSQSATVTRTQPAKTTKLICRVLVERRRQYARARREQTGS
jgi:multidrug resistance efflux pump